MNARTLVTCLSAALLGGWTAAQAAPKDVQAKEPSGKAAYKIESVLDIGGAGAKDDAQFYERVGSVDCGADAKGQIYVLDNGNHRVQVFDPSGRYLRSVGKEGEGPGEFKMPARFAVGADGSVAVFDMANQRTSLFDPAGKLVRDRIEDAPIKDLAFDPSGRLIVSQDTPDGQALIALDAKGAEAWAIRPAPRETGRPDRQLVIQMQGETMGSRLGTGKDGSLFAASGDAYGVQSVASGAVALQLSRPFHRVEKGPLPDPRREGEQGEGGERRMVMVRVERGGDGGNQTSVSEGHPGEGGETIQLTPDDLKSMLPKYRPDIRALLAWPDGRIWVLTAEDQGDSMIVDEWTTAGEYRARFTLPKSWDRWSMGADGKLYAVSHDEDDYPIVHRLSVTPL